MFNNPQKSGDSCNRKTYPHKKRRAICFVRAEYRECCPACGYNFLDIQIFSSYTPTTKKEGLIKLTVYDKTATGFEKYNWKEEG